MSNAYVDPRDMLNNFCFHVYAQKGQAELNGMVQGARSFAGNEILWSKVSSCQVVKLSLGHAEQLLFSCLCLKVTVQRWTQTLLRALPLSPDIRVHRAGSQLKR